MHTPPSAYSVRSHIGDRDGWCAARLDHPGGAYPWTNCSHDFEHWYARATSGQGMTVEGTNAQTTTPLHWSVDSSSSSTWDEASWIVHENGNDISNSLEVGFFSGWWPYPPYGWTDGLVAYYTKNNGATGVRPAGANAYVPANTNVHEAAVSSTGDLMGPGVNWVWNYFFTPNYFVAKPIRNLHQGEVLGTSSTWMGGGVGEQFQGMWMDDNRLYILGLP